MAPFYIGLSLLSNKTPEFRAGNRLLHAEGRRILGELSGCSIEEDIALEKGGRPYFADGRGDFSISHSASAAAVSWIPAETGTPLRTGCDIQYMRPIKSLGHIAESCFSPSEREYIFSEESGSMKRFYEIWVLKECYLKLLGLSLFDMPGLPSFISGNNFSFTPTETLRGVPLVFYLYELGDPEQGVYMLAAALESPRIPGEAHEDLPPVIRWYSQGSLPERSIAAIKAAVRPAKTVSPKT
jgi:phosphopantetheinyl transferase (holo-ACP synthase)